MSNWKYEKLSKLCSRIGDGLHGTPSYVEDSGIYFINGNNLKNGRIEMTNNTKCVSEEELKNNFIPLNENSLLLSINGTLGSMAFYRNEKVMLGKSSAYLNFKSPINKFYYYYFQLPFVQEYFFNVATGSTIKNLSLKSIQDFEVPVPEFNVWNSIASVLSALDSKIELNNKINLELEAMAKTLYDYWFVQFDFPDKNGKPYKTSGGKMVWNEELKREIPGGWEVGTLLNIANYENGLPCQKFRPTGTEFLRVIKIREMNEGFSTNTELVRTDIPEKAIIENGDVLFSWSASLDVKIWTGGKGALNQHIFKVTSKHYPKSFYFFQLINYLQHFKMMAENRKTTMGHITQEHLKQSRIAIPPKELTLELDKIIAPLFSKKVINEIENQKLTELRDWLLPMLMNGQVKVN
jgi:type I restriction enzyme S subunit